MSQDIELSIVMPCLNESKTVGTCIKKARAFLNEFEICGEIIIADNGSTDSSAGIASSLGARVVQVPEKGYGSALMGGIAAAQGLYVIMADADDSYDFSDLTLFIEQLRKGHDLVLGNRFSGGIEKGAMPVLHRYLGNPVLSFIGRLFFSNKIGDFHCGLRGFNKDRITDLALTCPGMEFASEMVVKASLAGYSIVEVPTKLSVDGRDGPPHLNSWRDGWRHLRFLLLFSPRWMFFYPGVALFFCGFILTCILMLGPVTLGNVVFDIHSLLYTTMSTILGAQMVFFAVMIQLIGMRFGRLPEHLQFSRFLDFFSLERGIVVGILCLMVGIGWTVTAISQWGEAGFSTLDPAVTMRETIPAVALIIIGVQVIFSSFFISAIELFKESKPAGRAD